MTNEIGLTWEELKDIVGMAYIHADSNKDDRLFEIRRWLDSKSGPINIVEEDKITKAKFDLLEAQESLLEFQNWSIQIIDYLNAIGKIDEFKEYFNRLNQNIYNVAMTLKE